MLIERIMDRSRFQEKKKPSRKLLKEVNYTKFRNEMKDYMDLLTNVYVMENKV